MSPDNTADTLNDGMRSVVAALQESKKYVESLPDKERVLWWLGFIGTAMASASTSIGGEAVRQIVDICEPLPRAKLPDHLS